MCQGFATCSESCVRCALSLLEETNDAPLDEASRYATASQSTKSNYRVRRMPPCIVGNSLTTRRGGLLHRLAGTLPGFPMAWSSGSTALEIAAC